VNHIIIISIVILFGLATLATKPIHSHTSCTDPQVSIMRLLLVVRRQNYKDGAGP